MTGLGTRASHLALAVALGMPGALAAADYVVASGQTDTTAKTLGNADTLTVEAGGTLVANTAQTVNQNGVATGVVVTNSGTIAAVDPAGRAFNTTGAGVPRTIAITNTAGGQIFSPDDALRIGLNAGDSVITVTNAGLIASTAIGQAIDFDALNSASSTVRIDNLAGGVIRSFGEDAVRPGLSTLNNAGTILADGAAGGAFDGVAAQARNATINNLAGGAISGLRSGVSSTVGIVVTNAATALISGRAGAGITTAGTTTIANDGTIGGALEGIRGVNLDVRNGAGAGIQGVNGAGIVATATATVANSGTISGGYDGTSAAADGDGVNVRGTAAITNGGTIQGTGSAGVNAAGQANTSEGIAIARGTVANTTATAQIIGADTGVRIDNPTTDAPPNIVNLGVIRGLAGAGVSAGNGTLTISNGGGIVGGLNGVVADDVQIVNGDGAVIAGGNGAGVAAGGSGIVTNSGTISGGYDGVSAAADGDGINIRGTAAITNGGTIQGTGSAGVNAAGQANTSEGVAIARGTVDNATASARIIGANTGVRIDGASADAPPTVFNLGLIQGLGGAGISAGGGTLGVSNGGGVLGSQDGITAVNVDIGNGDGAVIAGSNGAGITASGNGTVLNSGTISGGYDGTSAAADGDGINIRGTAAITNGGTIQGTGSAGTTAGVANTSEGIAIARGTVDNATSGAQILGANTGIRIDNATATTPPTVANLGLIRGFGGAGISAGGGTLSVGNGGGILGSQDGITAVNVDIVNDAGALIAGSNGAGIAASGSGTVANSGTISGGYDGASAAADGDGINIRGAGTISNSGTIQGTGSRGADATGQAFTSEGVAIARGTVNNSTADARIIGADVGVRIDTAATGAGASVTNLGLIRGLAGTGISAGGTLGVVNSGNVLGGSDGISGAAITISNAAGAVIAGANGAGIAASGNGTVVNGGTVSGAYDGTSASGDGDGIDIRGTATITNTGTIQGIGAAGLDAAGQPNIAVGVAIARGTVNNAATDARIFGATTGILIDTATGGAVPGVTNLGLISGATGSGIGAGGNLTVANGGGIFGGSDGISGAAITISNVAGAVVAGANGAGVAASGNATIVNAGTISGGANGSASGDGDGVDIRGTATITNSGTIQGTGAAGVDAAGQANVSEGIAIAAGRVENSAANAVIIGADIGVRIDNATSGATPSISNIGAIRGIAGAGISAGGTLGVANGGGIFGGSDAIGGAVVTIVNGDGAIIAGANGAGIAASGTGSVVNTGTISGGSNGSANGDGDGIDIRGIADIANAGTIQGTGAAGVDAAGRANVSQGIAIGGGTINNGATGALISGAGIGILADDGAGGAAAVATTISNIGTISGVAGPGILLIGNNDDSVATSGTISGGNGVALNLGAGNDTLRVFPGAAFTGAIDGGDGTDAVFLGGATDTVGTFAGSVNFETLNVQAGTWITTGTQSFVAINVTNGARLDNRGTLLGQTAVTSGEIVGGGTYQAVSLTGAATAIRPGGGGAIGTVTITGDYAQGRGATLAADITAAGAADRLTIGGAATLQSGAVLAITKAAGSYAPGTRYTLLTAAGGVSGTFGLVAVDNDPLTLTRVSYGANAVTIDILLNAAGLAAAATTPNQRAVAAGIAGLDINAPLYTVVAGIASATTLAGTFDALSGEVHADTHLGMLQDARRAAGAVERRLDTAVGRSGTWLQAVGASGSTKGANGAAGEKHQAVGAIGGIDVWTVDDKRGGFAGGYTRDTLRVDARASRATIGAAHVMAYGGGAFGRFNLRLAAGYSWTHVDTRRTVALPAATETPRASYSGSVMLGLGELAYTLPLGGATVSPFAGIEAAIVQNNGFTETGGLSALTVRSTSDSFQVGTVGVRVATSAEARVGVRAAAGLRHAFGNRTASLTATFSGSVAGFTATSAPLSREAGFANLDLLFRIGDRIHVGAGYAGVIGDGGHDHAARITLGVGL